MPNRTLAALRLPNWVIWLLLGLLAAAGFLHLGADFPNYSRWADDAAKFTDEGWYAAGALNHHLTGHWLRPGDFNPMVTIPVWSVLLAGIFHFTGLSIVVARAVAFAFTLGTVLLVGTLFPRERRLPAMLLVFSSPLLYFFSRLAILEAALLFFLFASACVLQAANRSAADAEAQPPASLLICSGVLFVMAMLVKSSAVFAAPALLYLLWFPRRGKVRRALEAVAIPLITVFVLYGIYWFLAVRTHPVDVRVLYAQNAPFLGLRSIPKAFRIVYRSFTWIDPILFPVALIGVIASLGPLRRLWRDPLFGFAVVFYVGYSGFLLVHFDAGPRYFAVLAAPVLILVLLFQQALAEERPAMGNVLNAIVLLAVLLNLAYIGRLLSRPSYTLRDAQLAIRNQIDADPQATRLVIGHGAMESSFTTLVPALDDMGAMPVVDKLDDFHPGWVVTYSDDLDILQQPEIAARYRFIKSGKYPVLDAPGRQYLMLFRVEPK